MNKSRKAYCYVSGCKSLASDDPDLSFHKFPRVGRRQINFETQSGDEKVIDLHKAWKLRLRIKHRVSEHIHVCSLHFNDNDFFPTSEHRSLKRLKPFAVPSKYLPPRKTNRNADQLLENEQNTINDEKLKKTKCFCIDEITYEPRPDDFNTVDLFLKDLSKHTDYKGPNNFLEFKKKKIAIFSLITTDKLLSSCTGLTSSTVLCSFVEMLKIHFLKQDDQIALNHQVILTLMKIKTELSFVALSLLSRLTQNDCKRYIFKIMPRLAILLRTTIVIPKQVEVNVPKCYKDSEKFKIVLDCFEIPIEKPKCLYCIKEYFSHCQDLDTIKFLVGISSNNLVIFISKPQGGLYSDEQVFKQSDFVEKVNSGQDTIMAVNDLEIEDICDKYNIELRKPHWKNMNKQVFENDDELTATVADAQFIIDNFCKQLKDFKIFSERLHWRLVPQIHSIFTIVCGVINLSKM